MPNPSFDQGQHADGARMRSLARLRKGRSGCGLAVVGVLVSLLLGASAAGGATSLRFSGFPTRALAGKSVSVALAGTRAKDVCSLKVVYADGSVQPALAAIKVGMRRVAWKWKVPSELKSGAARVTASCRAGGRITRSLRVAEVPVPLKIEVLKQGFSVRSKSGRDTVSYGLVLVNRSQTEDALDVTVLVNMVNASNGLLGSKSTKIPLIAAGSEYALGDSLSFRGAAPVAQLEVVVVRILSKQSALRRPVPSIGNVRIVPDDRLPDYVDAVEGELTNTSPKLVLEKASISGVVFDASGNVVGGVTGSAREPLLPGTRQFIELTGDVTSIATKDAATVQFSVDATYSEASP